MEHHAKFILTGRDNNSREENQSFLRDACTLIRCRWGAEAQLYEEPTLYVTATFTKYAIGLRRFAQGIGDLQWLLHIQKVQDGVNDEDAIRFILLQQKYNVQPLPASDPDEEQTSTGYHQKAGSSYQIKRKRN